MKKGQPPSRTICKFVWDTSILQHFDFHFEVYLDQNGTEGTKKHEATYFGLKEELITHIALISLLIVNPLLEVSSLSGYLRSFVQSFSHFHTFLSVLVKVTL